MKGRERDKIDYKHSNIYGMNNKEKNTNTNNALSPSQPPCLFISQWHKIDDVR